MPAINAITVVYIYLAITNFLIIFSSFLLLPDQLQCLPLFALRRFDQVYARPKVVANMKSCVSHYTISCLNNSSGQIQYSQLNHFL